MQQLLEIIARYLDVLINKLSTEDQTIVLAGSGFVRATGFFMYIPVSGSVHYVTFKGTDITTTLTTGWHPIKVKEIKSDSAVAVLASF